MAKQEKKEITHVDIVKDLQAKNYKPIYYLMGEESYYIDRIADYMANTILTEEEREFNQMIIYATPTTEMSTIINTAKRYPMMAEHQVIIVKEAQNLKSLDELSFYLQRPQPSTILVFCHKNGTLDKRKKITLEIEKTGVLFESKRMKETQLPGFIATYLKKKGIDIEPQASQLIAESIGSDLNRISSELDKLFLSLSPQQTRVTPELVERHIGISKDFNNFELRNALIEKNIFKANQIIKYFEENPKSNPLQVTLATLFNFFSNLMLAYYAPEKSEQGIAAQLGLRTPWQARDYMSAMRRYSAVKVMYIISDIRECDARSKGVGNPSTSNGDLLKELIYKILH
ncbi:MAG: DNA polymerase III subunit delta [Bacteroidaceae bacterium]|nr:DNA polymerase III subunit delta [Bacteroidaceae bacterium]